MTSTSTAAAPPRHGRTGVERRLSVADNLDALAKVSTASVGLVYMDPPFNTGRIFQARAAKRSASADAFDDTWTWNLETENLLSDLEAHLPAPGAAMVRALIGQLGKSPISAYLVALAARIGHGHRVLTRQGSLYLHVDPTASHYLKVVLDSVFGVENFRNEITWRRTHAHSGSRRFGPVHDTILFYSRSKNYVWNQQYSPYDKRYIEEYFRGTDHRGRFQAITCTGPGDRHGTLAHYEWNGSFPPPGRHWAWTEDEMRRLDADGRIIYSKNGVPRLKRYVDDAPGVRLQDVWSDISSLSAHSSERVGYDTQKPVALLERIIHSSSNPGDLVIDPYGGTGTTAVAAERAGRSWHVIDSSLYAASLALARTRREVRGQAIELSGMPKSEADAAALRRTDPRAFGTWATALLATELDRKSHRDDLAVGVRHWGNLAAGYVPLAAPQHIDALAGGAPNVTNFVVDGPGSAEITRTLRRAESATVSAVPLRSLVSRETTRTGKADIDLRLGE